MGKLTSIDSATAWGWALEALASSKHVAVSILHDLVAQIPPDLPADLRRSITERVALRCLEQLSSAHDAPPVRRPKLSLDLSESCEEVLKRITNESAECDVRMGGGGGGGRWKWDIESFVKCKRDCMPKCALNKLKELIGDDSHPYAELLGSKSGVGSVTVAGSDGILRFDGGCSNVVNNGGREERDDESALPNKRSRIELDTEKVADEIHEDDGSGVNANRRKRYASYALQSGEDNLVPLAGRHVLEQALGRDIPVFKRQGCVLEFQKEIREAELTTSGVAPSHEAQRKVSAEDSGHKMEHGVHIDVPRAVSLDESKQKSIADEARDESDQLPEPTALHVGPPDKAQHMLFDKNQSQLDFIAKEKRKFLSSKCTLARYCNSTEKDHCLMCNGGGQLLICSTSDCPLVYHESCMGSEFISYVSGDFYCPFCAYCLHLKEFQEVEKEALQLRNNLNSFNSVLGSS